MMAVMSGIGFLLLMPSLVLGTVDDTPVWRQSMVGTCWTNSSCDRAMIVSHGGAPDYVDRPYDSMAAFVSAAKDGTDCVKGDFRVTKDNVGMVMHSSPIEAYESLNCVGRKVEEMTEAEAVKCTMLPTTEHFISVPELLSWAEDKVIVMLCVKESRDIARAISTLVENNATHRAFLEIRVNELLGHVLQTKPVGWDSVYYLAEMGSASDLTTLLSPTFAPLLPRLFTFEFDPSYTGWGLNISKTVSEQLHPRGVKSLAATDKVSPSALSQEKLWRTGFDIVYTYGTPAGVRARTTIDKERGVTPAAP